MWHEPDCRGKPVPTIPGLVLRPYRGGTDHPQIKAIYDACKEADCLYFAMPLQRVAEDLEFRAHSGRSHAQSDMVFAEIAGQVAGYGYVEHEQENSGERIYSTHGLVVPAWRRRGIGAAILRANEQRIREIAAEHPEGTKWVQSEHNDHQPGAAALLGTNGYREVRWSWLLTRRTGDPLPPAPMPAGLQVRPATADNAFRIVRALEDVFAEDPHHVPSTDDDLRRMLAYPDWDFSLWRVAWDGEEVAGMILNYIIPHDTETAGRRCGWTDPVAVRRPYRRRGLARSLLAQSVQAFRDRGFDETVMLVDSHNPYHAMEVYQSVGYRAVRKDTVCHKPLG